MSDSNRGRPCDPPILVDVFKIITILTGGGGSDREASFFVRYLIDKNFPHFTIVSTSLTSILQQNPLANKITIRYIGNTMKKLSIPTNTKITAHDWGPVIKRKRRDLAETQAAFGSRFGVSAVAVSYWERNMREIPARVTWWLYINKKEG